MKKLNNKVAIITGAAQGIGAAYAQALAIEGASVLVADIVDGKEVVSTINNMGGRAIYQHVDVSSEHSVNEMIERALNEFGRIDILVNNAAIYASLSLQPFDEISPEQWDQVMSVNVKGPFLCARAVIPQMRKQNYGRIINISSGTPFKGTPYLLHYVTSKGAILALTRALAREVGNSGICVNTLAPGLVLSEGVLENTELLSKLSDAVMASRAIKRDQTPEDLIQPLIFLASDDSAFITGETLVVDGGSVMH